MIINYLNIENLTPRQERKFCIDPLYVNGINNLIRNNQYFFNPIYYPRQVNNLYFDTYDLESFWDNSAGNNEKVKFRIRWYGKLFGLIDNPVLEVKIKVNLFGYKLRFPLQRIRIDENINSDYFMHILDKEDIPENIKNYFKELRPTLLNSYNRKYFSSLIMKQFRLTVDANVSYYYINTLSNVFKNNTCRYLYIDIL